MQVSEYNRLNVSVWLKKWRISHNLTQGTVASETGVNINSVQAWERGYGHPNAENFIKLVNYVNRINNLPKPPKQRNW